MQPRFDLRIQWDGKTTQLPIALSSSLQPTHSACGIQMATFGVPKFDDHEAPDGKSDRKLESRDPVHSSELPPLRNRHRLPGPVAPEGAPRPPSAASHSNLSELSKPVEAALCGPRRWAEE